MGEVYDISELRSSRRKLDQMSIEPKNPNGKLARYLTASKEVQDQIDEGPPIKTSKPMEEMTVEEKLKLFQVLDFSARMAGLDFARDWPNWTDEQIEEVTEEVYAQFEELAEEQQTAIRQRIADIEEYEATLLGISKEE